MLTEGLATVDQPMWRIERWEEGTKLWVRSTVGSTGTFKTAVGLMTYDRCAKIFAEAITRWPLINAQKHLYRLRNTRTNDTVMGALL